MIGLRHIQWAMRRAALAAPIPALRPPREPLAPSLWERHGWALALGFLVAAAGGVWWARRKRAHRGPPTADSLAIARAKLASLEVGDGPDLVSQILRWGLLEHFQLPWLEYTTEELQAMLEQKGCLPGELIEAWRRLLEDCDRARFAGETGATGTLRTRALALLERISRLPVGAAGGGTEPARTT